MEKIYYAVIGLSIIVIIIGILVLIRLIARSVLEYKIYKLSDAIDNESNPNKKDVLYKELCCKCERYNSWGWYRAVDFVKKLYGDKSGREIVFFDK